MFVATEELNEYRKKFHAHYYENILPKLQRFEALRQKELVKYQILMFLIGLTILIGLFVFVYFFITKPCCLQTKNSPLELIIFIIAGVCSLFGFLAFKVGKNFENKVKKIIMSSFLSFFGAFRWSDKDRIPQPEIENSKLFSSFNRYSSDDYFEGVFKELNIIISEVDLKRETNSGKNRTVIQIFKGILIKICMQKKFDSQTVVTANGQGFFSFLGGELQKVELEDPEFNKMFDVLSNNQVEARYILTTAFMERFKALRNIYKANDIRASFLDNNVTIAIPCKRDMFKLGKLTLPVTDSGQFQEFFEEFIAVLALIDLLKLDTKTGL